MGVRGEIQIDYAVFADTGAEPAAVMSHLAWLQKQCVGHFPVHVVQKSNIYEDIVAEDRGQRFASVPFFTLSPEGKKGTTRRHCTKEYKVEMVDRCIRRDILGLSRGQHMPKDVYITQLVGMSAEEGSRVLKVRARFADLRYAVPEFPLYERGMSREDCVQWLKDYGVPHETPRSACIFCPYKSDDEWIRLRNDMPEEWRKVAELDAAIRRPGGVVSRKLNGRLYLHRSCLPIDQVAFQPRAGKVRPAEMSDECDGMCGT